jgi:alkaline phosphatase
VLLVEGSRIDHAGHSNDIAAHLHDIISFNEAFQTAVNFAMQDEQTCVIYCRDDRICVILTRCMQDCH